MSVSDRVLSGMGWQTASVVLQAVLQMAVLAVLARHLDARDFGLVAIANIFIGLVGLLAQVGIGPAIIQRKEMRPSHVTAGFLFSVIIGVTFAAAVFASSSIVAGFFDEPGATVVMQWLSLTFIINSIGNISESVLLKEFEFRKLLVVSTASYSLGYALVGIFFAIRGFGALSIVFAMLSQCVVRSCLLVALRRPDFSELPRWAEMLELLQFGGGVTLTRFFNYVSLQGDRFIVGKWLGSSLLGVYQLAFQIMILPGRYLGDILDKVMFPAMSEVQGSKDRLKTAYYSATAAANMVIIPIAVLLVVNAKDVVVIVLGSNWSGVVLPLQIMLLTVGFRISTRVSDVLIRATGYVYRSAMVKAVFAVATVGGALFGSKWGLAGVAVAVGIAVLMNYLMMSTLSLSVIGGSWASYWGSQKSALLLGASVLCVAGGVTAALQALNVPHVVVLAGSVLGGGSSVGMVVVLFPSVLGPAGRWLGARDVPSWLQRRLP